MCGVRRFLLDDKIVVPFLTVGAASNVRDPSFGCSEKNFRRYVGSLTIVQKYRFVMLHIRIVIMFLVFGPFTFIIGTRSKAFLSDIGALFFPMRDFFRYDFRLNRDPDTIRITIDYLSIIVVVFAIATSDSMVTRRNKNPPTGFLFDIFFFRWPGPLNLWKRPKS